MFPNTQNSSKFSLKVKSAILDLGALFPLTARLRRKQLSVLFSQKISFLRKRLRAGLCLTENSRQTPPKTDSKKQEAARQKMRRTKRGAPLGSHIHAGDHMLSDGGLRYIKRVDGAEMGGLRLLRINRGFPQTFHGSSQCYMLFHKI